MDFARKQLEKYGWTDGKGLGKHENGISVPLKPKIKRSVAGVGHDPASEFTEHWWTKLYDKAAENVEIEEKHGKTKKIKIKDEKFKITSNTWQINSKQTDEQTDNQDGYSEYFVKKAILTSGGSKTERLKESESESEDEKVKQDVFKLTDEELFAACEGRTAHKGARHGLKATGKLARIERQESILLTQPQYKGYSHAEKIKRNKQIFETTAIENSNSDAEKVVDVKKKKKRKHKHCNAETYDETQKGPEDPKTLDDKSSEAKMGLEVADIYKSEHENQSKNKRKKKHKDDSETVKDQSTEGFVVIENYNGMAENNEMDTEAVTHDQVFISKKKKKNKNNALLCEQGDQENSADVNEIADVKEEIIGNFNKRKLKKKRKKASLENQDNTDNSINSMIEEISETCNKMDVDNNNSNDETEFNKKKSKRKNRNEKESQKIKFKLNEKCNNEQLNDSEILGSSERIKSKKKQL